MTASALVAEARTLFTAYRDFLKTIESTHHFDFLGYEQETAGIPSWYSDHGGALFLALVDGISAGCIAFRAVEPKTCEIKRLFVLPAFRQKGIARALIAEALQQAQAAAFTRAILDTDVVSMPAAYATYLALGFREYTAEAGHAPSLRLLEREL